MGVIEVEETEKQETPSETPIKEKITGIFKRDQSSSSSSSDSDNEKEDVKPLPHKEEEIRKKPNPFHLLPVQKTRKLLWKMMYQKNQHLLIKASLKRLLVYSKEIEAFLHLHQVHHLQIPRMMLKRRNNQTYMFLQTLKKHVRSKKLLKLKKQKNKKHLLKRQSRKRSLVYSNVIKVALHQAQIPMMKRKMLSQYHTKKR